MGGPTHVGGRDFEALQDGLLRLAETVEKLLRLDDARDRQIQELAAAISELRGELRQHAERADAHAARLDAHYSSLTMLFDRVGNLK